MDDRRPLGMTGSAQSSVSQSALVPQRANWRHRLRQALPTLLLSPVLIYLVLVPLAILVWSSVKPTGLPRDEGFTLANYAIYSDIRTYRLLWTSVQFAVGSTLIALFFGVTLAWLIERTDLPVRNLFRGLIVLPMAIPPVLLAIAWVLLLSPQIGFFNTVLQSLLGLKHAPFNIYSMMGMIFVQGIAMVPTAFLMLSPAFRNMDPALEEAARTSGASSWTILRRVVLPMMRPAIVAASVFLCIISLVVFDIPGVIGLPRRIFVLSSEVFLRTNPPGGLPKYGEISALALLFLLILLGLSALYHLATSRAFRFVTITGRGFAARVYALGRWRYLATAFVLLYFFLAVIAPLAILVWTSLLRYYSGVSIKMLSLLTLRNHQQLFNNPHILEAVGNSITIAVVSATVVALLAAIVSWVVVRSRAPGRRLLDLLAFMPIAIPGIMMGLALIYVYLTIRVVPIYGTIWIIALAYIAIYLPFGSRTANGVLLQIHKDLEEAAEVSGASWLQSFQRVSLPLIRPALVSVWIWVTAHAMRELSVALMLQGLDNTVIPTLLWGYWESGRPTVAAATGVWLIIALAALVVIWQLVERRLSNNFTGIGGGA